jgi:hypothetical protein
MKRMTVALALALAATNLFANPFGFVTYLVPINPGVVAGADGTQWQTTLWFSNASDQEAQIVCDSPLTCPTLRPHSTTSLTAPYANLQHQGFFVAYVQHLVAGLPPNSVFGTLRTNDSASSPHSAGTEIPLVRPDAFHQAITLPHVPLNGHSRLRLRVYGYVDTRVTVRAIGLTTNSEVWSTTLQAKGAGPALTIPSYAEIDVPSTFAGDDAIRIELTAGVADQVIWAFVSITDDESQQFTLVTPADGEYIPHSTA